MIRKSCRWLSLSAALCMAASGLPGCSSKPLLSGLRLPGTKSKVGAEEPVASSKKLHKATDGEAADLLAQAQDYEKQGDFPNAAKAYRLYFEKQGSGPSAGRPQSPSGTDQSALASKARQAPKPDSDVAPIRSVSKEKTQPRKTIDPETPRDPWAELAELQAEQPKKQPSTLPQTAQKKPTRPSEAVAGADQSAELPEWASSGRPVARTPSKVSDEDLNDLLDLDEGELDWGDASAEQPEETVAAVDPVETRATSEDELPRFDLFNTASETPGRDEATAREDEGMSPPQEDVVWNTHAADTSEMVPETESEAPPEDQLAGSTESALDGLAPPILEDSTATPEPLPGSLATLCKDCEPQVSAWVIKLESSDPEARKEALAQLANCGSAARPAGEAVRTILFDTDPLVQCHAAWTLWEIENETIESVQTLTTLLNHRKSDVVQLACYMLGEIGPPAEAASDGLVVLRDHAESTTQIHAAEALIRIRGSDRKSVELLRNSLKSQNSQERWLAAVALGRCRGEQSPIAVEALTKCLHDVEVDVRCAAALSLGGLGVEAKPAIHALEQVAHRDDSNVRDAANAALACIRK